VAQVSLLAQPQTLEGSQSRKLGRLRHHSRAILQPVGSVASVGRASPRGWGSGLCSRGRSHHHSRAILQPVGSVNSVGRASPRGWGSGLRSRGRSHHHSRAILQPVGSVASVGRASPRGWALTPARGDARTTCLFAKGSDGRQMILQKQNRLKIKIKKSCNPLAFR